jgi:hypothetical protein
VFTSAPCPSNSSAREGQDLDRQTRRGEVGECIRERIVGGEELVTAVVAEIHDLVTGVAEVVLAHRVGHRGRIEREDLLDRAAMSAAAVQIEHYVGLAVVLEVQHVHRDALARRRPGRAVSPAQL